MEHRRRHTPTLRELAPDAPHDNLVAVAVFYEYLLEGYAFDPEDERSVDDLHAMVEADVGEAVERDLVLGALRNVIAARHTDENS